MNCENMASADADIRNKIGDLLDKLANDAHSAHLEGEHILGNAPRQWNRWNDPVEVINDIPLPTVDDALRHWSTIHGDNIDGIAADCIGAELEARLYDVAARHDIPAGACDDVLILIQFE